MFSKKMFANGLNCQNSIQDEDKPGRLTTTSTTEMIESDKMLFLVDKRVTIEKISEVGISLDTAHRNLHNDLAFSKVNFRRLSKM